MAKKTKDFAKADAMRETLRMAGVEVMDREKLWRAIPPPQGAVGGPPQPIPQAPMAQSARPSANQQLQYHRARDDDKPVDVRAVEALLDERLACKMQRDFVRADQLRDQLKQMHNVEVHDTQRVWHRPARRQSDTRSAAHDAARRRRRAAAAGKGRV